MSRINDVVVKIGTVNGTGSASANGLLMKAIFRMGVPVVGVVVDVLYDPVQFIVGGLVKNVLIDGLAHGATALCHGAGFCRKAR